jgi:SAM-dependent methyltransferase
MTKKKSKKGAKKDQRPKIFPVVKAREHILRRPWRSRPGTPKVVSEYLPKAGMTAKVSEELFRSDLRARFGDAAERYLESCRVSHYDSVESHAIMSPNLDMATAIRSQYWGDRCEAFLSWFVTAGLPRPGRILDIGCDTGIQTCFFATFYPESQVTGVDQCAKSLQCAQRLAERLGLKNVRFVQATLPELPPDLVSQMFEMVVSSFVANYFDDEVTVPVRSIEEAQSTVPDPQLGRYARLLAGFLADEESLLVGFERYRVPVRLARWIWALRDAGICIRKDRIELIEFSDESDESAYAPAFVATKRGADLMTPDEIRHLWLKDFLRRGRDVAYHCAAIEQDFVSESPKELLKGAHCTFPKLSPFCKELWLAGSDVLLYVYNSNGGVILDAAPAEELAEMLEIFEIAFCDKGRLATVEYGPEGHGKRPDDANGDDASDVQAGGGNLE